MADFKDIIKLDIQVNGSKAQKELLQLEETMSDIKSELNGMKRGTKEYIAKSQELKKVEEEWKNIASQMETSEMTLKQLNKQIKNLSFIRSQLQPGSDAFNNYSKQIEIAIARKKQLMDNTSLYQKALGSLKSTAMQIGPALVAMLGVQAIIGKTGDIIRRNAELDDSLADVMKTTGMTKTEVQQLAGELKKMNTRTSRAELLELAYAAGKLGNQGQEDVLGFVRAADKIQVALGKDLGKDAITTIGKLVNIFKLKEQFGLEEGMLKIASAMNDLGMASEASEGYLAEFMKRMGGVAPLVKLTAPETLALGATLDSLGQTSEVSSTALSKLFIQFAKDSEVFAKFAKMDGADFRKLMDENFMEAFIAVLEGVKDNSNGINELTATLGDMGVEGGRVVGVLGTLANNTGKLREQINLGNAAFEKGTSVIDEFNIKNETLAAKIEKLNKAFASFFANSNISKTVASGVDALARVIDRLTKAQKSQQDVMRETNSEMNVAINVLRTANFSTDERRKYIDELNKKYGPYLSRLILEKDTLEDIATIQEASNKQMLGKIFLMDYQKEVEDAAAKVSGAIKSMYETKIDEEKLKSTTEDLPAAMIAAQNKLNTNWQANNKDIVANQDKTLQDIEKKYEKLFEMIGLKFSEFKPKLNNSSLEDLLNEDKGGGGGGTTETGLTDEQKFEQELADFLKRSRQERFLDSLSADEREIANADIKYKELVERAAQYNVDLAELEADWEMTIDEIMLKQAEKRKALKDAEREKEIADLNNFKEQLRLMGLDDEAREEEELILKYDKIAQANADFYEKELIDYKIFTDNWIAIENLKNAELENLRAKNLANIEANTDKEIDLIGARQQAASMILGGMSNLFGQIAKNDKALLVFKQLAAISEIGINAAIGMSKAATQGGPIRIAIAMSAVLGAIGSAMSAIKSVKQPPEPQIQTVRQRRKGGFIDRNPSTGASIPLKARVRGEEDGMSYNADLRPDIRGGMLSRPSLVLAGEAGEEYFVNSTMLQDPLVSGVVGAMEQKRLGRIRQADFRNILQDLTVSQFKNGGYTDNTPAPAPANNGDGGMSDMMSQYIAVMNNLNQKLERGIYAIIPDETIVDFDSRKQVLDDVKQTALGR